MERKIRSRFLWYIVAAIVGILFFGLVVMAVFARPIADEYYFMTEIRSKGIFGYAFEQYMTWGGRLAQSFISGISYKFFGSVGSQIVVSMTLLVSFGAAWSWLISQLADFGREKFVKACLVGFLVAATIMYCSVCLFDIYLWLDSAVVHFLGMIVVVYDSALFVWLVKNRGKIRKRKMVWIFMILAFCGQTVSEASMLIVLGWSGIALIISSFVKRYKTYRRVCLLMFVVLLLGGLVMALAPGLWTRAGAAKATVSLVELAFARPIKSIANMIVGVSVWKWALMITVGILASNLAFGKKLTSCASCVKIGIFEMLLFLTFIYFPLLVYFFGGHAVSAEARVLGIPSMGLVIMVITLVIFLCDWVDSLMSGWKYSAILRGVVVVAVAIFMLLSARGIYQFNKGYFAVLVTRASALERRNALIALYKSGEIDKLVVADIPVMIEGSDATDFSANNFTLPEWFYRSFLTMYDLSDGELTVLGGKLAYENQTEWYKEVGNQVCTVTNSIVFSKYYCGNVLSGE